MRTSPYCAMSSSSIRSSLRIRRTSASGRSSMTTTTSSSWSLRRRPGRGPAGRVHCLSPECFLLTIHRDEAPAFTEVWHGYRKRKAPIDEPALLLYRIIDALVDSFVPMADFDDRIDELENQTFLHASDEQLQELLAMKRLPVDMRKAVIPTGTCLPV